MGVKYLVIGYNEPGFHIVSVLRKLASARISHSFFIVFDRPSVFTYGGLLRVMICCALLYTSFAGQVDLYKSLCTILRFRPDKIER